MEKNKLETTVEEDNHFVTCKVGYEGCKTCKKVHNINFAVGGKWYEDF